MNIYALKLVMYQRAGSREGRKQCFFYSSLSLLTLCCCCCSSNSSFQCLLDELWFPPSSSLQFSTEMIGAEESSSFAATPSGSIASPPVLRRFISSSMGPPTSVNVLKKSPPSLSGSPLEIARGCGGGGGRGAY